jgi:acyl-CoA thioesterase I
MKGMHFPQLFSKKIDSLGLSYRVVNSGLSGETSAGGLRRIDWVLQQNVDVFVLELGRK